MRLDLRRGPREAPPDLQQFPRRQGSERVQTNVVCDAALLMQALVGHPNSG